MWRSIDGGAKLGAILCGPHQTGVDGNGIETTLFQALWTPMDTYGRRLEIYGSEGWGFESCRARQRVSLQPIPKASVIPV